MSYNGWTNWDTWNTVLLLENDQSTYKWLIAWGKNFHAKKKRKVFKMKMAESVVEKYLIPVARGKTRAGRKLEYGDPEIDPKKVNKKEIVKHILDDYNPKNFG